MVLFKNSFTYLSFKAVYSFQTLKLFILFRLCDPFIHYLFFAAIASFFAGNNYLQFIVLGNIVFYTTQTMLINFIALFLSERVYGTLELNIAAPMKTPTILIRKSLVPLLDASFVFISGLGIGALIFDLFFEQSLWPQILMTIATLLFSIYCFGLLIGALSLLFHNIHLFLNSLLVVFQLFCGINFNINLLPESLQYISSALPLTHGIQALRILYGLGEGDFYQLLIKEMVIGIIYLTIALCSINILENYARKYGSLTKNKH